MSLSVSLPVNEVIPPVHFKSSLPSAGGLQASRQMSTLFARVPGMINFCAGLTVEYLTHTAKCPYIPVINRDNLVDVQREKVRKNLSIRLNETFAHFLPYGVQLRSLDPVHQASIDKYLTTKLEELVKARPVELSRDRLLQMLNPAILQQLTALLEQRPAT